MKPGATTNPFASISMDSRGRMTKQGNNNLRHALFLAANVARRYDPELKASFDKKRSEGKQFTVAVVCRSQENVSTNPCDGD